jgi:hypothetical protein
MERSYKINPNWDFLFENIPSGNPELYCEPMPKNGLGPCAIKLSAFIVQTNILDKGCNFLPVYSLAVKAIYFLPNF